MMYAEFEKAAETTLAVSLFFSTILDKNIANAVLIPNRTLYSLLPMPTLITSSKRIVGDDILAPVAPFNTAKLAKTVLSHDIGKKIAVFLRPCEIRALIELTKLNQCTLDNAILISMDCFGRMENGFFLERVTDDPEVTKHFFHDELLRKKVTRNCKSCELFYSNISDINLCLVDIDNFSGVNLLANTPKGEEVLRQLDLDISNTPQNRTLRLDGILKIRSNNRFDLIKKINKKIKTLELFQEVIGTCLNCHSCETACPVCYCKECVFKSNVFNHKAELLFSKAFRTGKVKLPLDTAMFHLTRMSHVAHSCVGCGQCSSACPSNIPIADVFQSVSDAVQKHFCYSPGLDPNELLPFLLDKRDDSP